MKHTPRLGFARSLISTLLVCAAFSPHVAANGATVDSAGVTVGDLSLEGAWARASMAGMKMGAGYLTIANEGKADDELLTASSPVAEAVEIHLSQLQDGVMRMREVGATALPAGQRVRFLPGGLHLMFMGLKSPFEAGQSIPVTLRFREAGEVTVSFEVRSGR
jgi:copper(I)-binding protein